MTARNKHSNLHHNGVNYRPSEAPYGTTLWGSPLPPNVRRCWAWL